jgi:mRNA-degrading endonuclease RelE of RelBE toxin-antitoxin system
MWKVVIPRKVAKSVKDMPNHVQAKLEALILDIRANGPIRGNWPNYSKLGRWQHHCHLKKGNPTYVAVWMESGTGIQLVEVQYVGTHEKAPY